jgi:membrane-bound serine protease (ClpP class)
MTSRTPAARRVRVPRLGALLLLAGLVAGLLSSSVAAQPAGPTVDVVEITGVIDRTTQGFLIGAIRKVNAEGSEVLVVRLDTPGGLGVTGEAIVAAIDASRVPVAVWVGPPGARAAGAGVWIAEAAHVLALAPATAFGVAWPADLADGGGTAGDVAADLAALAESRGRDPGFAEAAVRDGATVVAVPDGESGVSLPPEAALPEGSTRDAVETLDGAALRERGIADVVAAGLPEVLTELNGRQVDVAAEDGGTVDRTLDVNPETARVRFHNPGLPARVLHTVADPTFAYLLLLSGALAILFEVFQPGFGVAGFAGLLLFGLGLYGLTVLPVGWVGFALLLLGLALLAVDLALAGLGVLTAAGAAAVGVGSYLLFPGPQSLRPALWLIVSTVAFVVLFFVVIMTTVLRAQGRAATVGAQALVGKVGVVRSMLNPEGHVFVNGALWRARAPDAAGRVKTGTTVRVLRMNDRMTLDVELVDAEESSRV